MVWRLNIRPNSSPRWRKNNWREPRILSTRHNIDDLVARDAARIAQAQALAAGDARGEAQILLAHALDRSRAWVMAHGPDRIAPDSDAVRRYAELLRRRLNGEPIAYILGEREFYALAFDVNEHVLIPRPETELLVDTALSLLPKATTSKVLDLGTGSGCIAAAIAAHAARTQVLAVDSSHDALAVAAANVQRHHIENLDLMHSDWYTAVTPLRFDVIVSNPPYVAKDDPHLLTGDLRFEPQAALTPGEDALASIRQIIHQAPDFLRAAGWLLIEHGHDQGNSVRTLLERRRFRDVSSRRDLACIERISFGRIT